MRPESLARPLTALRSASGLPRAAAPLRRSTDGPDLRHRGPLDVLFVSAVAVLLAVHLAIFFATLVLAPVTVQEARSLALLQLPVEVARALVLPFHALLLGSLFVIGRRAAGRWAGFGSMLAVLALDLRADAADPVYGPAIATGGWVAASLIAAAFVALPRRRLVSAALIGAASGCAAMTVLALPAFLIAIGIARDPRGGSAKARSLGAFTGVWAVVAAAFQVVWLSRLGADGWLARAAAYTAEFRPHAIVPFLEQQRLLFAAWHFDPLVTFCLALFLFAAAGTGVARYLLVPHPDESGRLRVLRRFPPELWAASLLLLLSAVWWGLSGDTVIIDPNLPVLAAVAPLITAMAYRGAKWLMTVNRFWAVSAVLYLIGLILARSTQLVITLVQAFHP